MFDFLVNSYDQWLLVFSSFFMKFFNGKMQTFHYKEEEGQQQLLKRFV